MLLAAALVLSPTQASADANDTAMGSGTIGTNQWHCPTAAVQSFEFSATGIGTPAASGTFSFSCTWTGQPTSTWSGVVDCLQFHGNTVVIGGATTSTNVPVFPIGELLHFAVGDGGSGSPDRISDLYAGGACEPTPAQYDIQGEISVHKSPQCNDGVDNDGDGFTDFPADPGCSDGTDDTESPNPPSAPSCDGRRATVYVANGRIVGGPDSGQLYAGTLRGTTGADVINGTTGADTVIAGGGGDLVCSLGGVDRVDGEGDADKLIGGAGNDSLTGGTGADTLQGRAGNDTLTGNEGADRFVGGPGTDTASDYSRVQGDTRTTVP